MNVGPTMLQESTTHPSQSVCREYHPTKMQSLTQIECRWSACVTNLGVLVTMPGISNKEGTIDRPNNLNRAHSRSYRPPQ
jgi:hypothetical protein